MPELYVRDHKYNLRYMNIKQINNEQVFYNKLWKIKYNINIHNNNNTIQNKINTYLLNK